MKGVILWLFLAGSVWLPAQAQQDTTTTSSGLKLVWSQKGEGPLIKKGQKLKVNYSGAFPNGKVFDQGKAYKFTMGEEGFIPAWDEAFLLLRKGDKVTFVAHPSIAYGKQGIKDDEGVVIVPANATLVFSIEVLDVK